MEEKKEKQIRNYSRSIFLLVAALIILLVSVVSLSLAVFFYGKKGTINNTIITGTLTMTYTEGTTGISITNALPMSDEAGKKLSGEGETFKFVVSSTINGDASINYEIAAIKKEESTINDGDVRIYLEKSIDNSMYQESLAPSPFIPINSASKMGSPAGSMILESGSFNQTQTNSYILRMWLAESMKTSNIPQSYVITVNVYGDV